MFVPLLYHLSEKRAVKYLKPFITTYIYESQKKMKFLELFANIVYMQRRIRG